LTLPRRTTSSKRAAGRRRSGHTSAPRRQRRLALAGWPARHRSKAAPRPMRARARTRPHQRGEGRQARGRGGRRQGAPGPLSATRGHRGAGAGRRGSTDQNSGPRQPPEELLRRAHRSPTTNGAHPRSWAWVADGHGEGDPPTKRTGAEALHDAAAGGGGGAWRCPPRPRPEKAQQRARHQPPCAQRQKRRSPGVRHHGQQGGTAAPHHGAGPQPQRPRRAEEAARPRRGGVQKTAGSKTDPLEAR